MFTGIVENVGRVISFEEKKESWLLKLDIPFDGSDGMEAGASLSVNGCCLTFREDSSGVGSFDLLDETLERSCANKKLNGDAEVKSIMFALQ